MGKGSNASKIARARADAAKRAAKQGQGGGGRAGLLQRQGGNTEENLAKAMAQRAEKKKRRAEREAKRIAEEKRREAERAKARGKEEAPYPPFKFIKNKLEEWYKANAPEKIGNLEKILAKFDGKWGKLEAGLRKNYGDKAPDFRAMYGKQ